MNKIVLFLLIPIFSFAHKFSQNDNLRCQEQAKQVTIIRDTWGIPHVYGKTDADAVFGLLYAQCEDDFSRVEMNYIEKLGRIAEVKGESELYNDLLIRLVIDSADAIKDYQSSPAWLKKLLNAYADGINYYLYKHPSVQPLLLNHFEPWYPLLWTDGSIGAINVGDINSTELRNFYSGEAPQPIVAMSHQANDLPGGSNGFAIAPSKTASGNAILYINPHVTFYFRPEVEVESEEGLHTYGAITWGQFFVYQGFNEHCGWMHTSSYADVADLYSEKVIQKNNHYTYLYDGKERVVKQKKIRLLYNDNGTLKEKIITSFSTHHGPVMAIRNGHWISVKAVNRSMRALIQSWQRTKSKGFEDFKKNMQRRTNTSNNTVFADDKGNIAYWHGNFMPIRNTNFNWAKPVDGSIKATEWKGLHDLDEIVHVYNPASGWIQNCNSTPFTVSGISSPIKTKYPAYMAPDGQNFRGINAANVLANGYQYTIESIIKAGYNTHLSAFDELIPALLKAYTAEKNILNNNTLDEAIQLLGSWDRNCSETSVATTIAIEWAQKIWPTIMKGSEYDDEADQVERTKRYVSKATPQSLLKPLIDIQNELVQKFGSWQVQWGSINRYQRLTGKLEEQYDDNKPSLPDGFAASVWGCLPSFVSKTYTGTNKRYGYNGNSFICAIEFGKKIKAKSLLAGGESGDLNSPHFNDQALMYTKGEFKDVLFYKEDVLQHVEKTYHPGE